MSFPTQKNENGKRERGKVAKEVVARGGEEEDVLLREAHLSAELKEKYNVNIINVVGKVCTGKHKNMHMGTSSQPGEG